MTPFLQLIFVLSIILLSAKLAGYLSTRFGQPSVLGELLVGVILGPSLIDLTHLPLVTDAHLTEIVVELGELGVLLLMFIAGLELHLSDLAKNTRVSAYAGTMGVILPVFLGWVIGELNGMNFSESAFLGLTLGATSVSISAQTLMELNVLRSRVGLGLLGAAVFDDVLVILLLSTFLALNSGSGGIVSILIVIVKMVGFLGLSVLFGLYLLPRLLRTFSRLRISQGTLTLTLVILLAYGLAAEVIGGMAAITGTFVAGLMFSRTPQAENIEPGLHALAYGLFVPVFFVSIGLAVDVKTLDLSTIWLLLLIIVVAILGKLLGAGFGARLAKFSWRESFQLGTGMISRGEVGLIVAQVGLNQDLLTNEVFSSIVGMVLVTTLVTPPMLRSLFARAAAAKPEPQEVRED